MTAPSVKDKIRSGILNGKKIVKSETMSLFGTEIELRQATLSTMAKIARATEADSKTPGVVRILIEYAYVPGTEDKLFSEADVAELSQLPGGPWVKTLNAIVGRLSGADVDAAEKN